MIEPLTETEKAYLAGFFDGEGCINISKNAPGGCPVAYHRLIVSLAQCNEGMLKGWQERTGLGAVYPLRRSNFDSGNWTPAFQWRIESAQAEIMLRWIMPYLQLKLEEAKVALLFLATMTIRPSRGNVVSPAILQLRDEYMQRLKDMKPRNSKDANEVMSPDVIEAQIQPTLF